MFRGDFGTFCGDPAGFSGNGEGVPGFSGTEAIEVSRFEVSEDLLWREDDDTDLRGDIEAGVLEPLEEEVKVCGVPGDYGEGELPAAVADVGEEVIGGADSAIGEIF